MKMGGGCGAMPTEGKEDVFPRFNWSPDSEEDLSWRFEQLTGDLQGHPWCLRLHSPPPPAQHWGKAHSLQMSVSSPVTCIESAAMGVQGHLQVKLGFPQPKSHPQSE